MQGFFEWFSNCISWHVECASLPSFEVDQAAARKYDFSALRTRCSRRLRKANCRASRYW